jgi:predicted PurR-regulated permease PerM
MTNKELAPYPFIRLSALVILAAAVFFVLRPFLHALVWVSVVTLTAWPLNMYFRRKIPFRSEALAAVVMTVLLAVLILGVVLPTSFGLASEVSRLVTLLRESAAKGDISLPESLRHFTWLNEYVEMVIAQGASKTGELSRLLDEYQPQIISVVSFAALGLWGLLVNVGLTIFSSYFFFRYGDILSSQLFVAAQRMGGNYYVDLVQTSWNTVRGVVFGEVGAAISQGILAGLGYYVCDVPLPLLLGALTILLGLLPYGPAILYLPISLFMLLSGAPWYYGIGLAVWGIAVVSTVDNLVRSCFISQGTNLPILLAFFGGLGGIAAFGMVGLFVGPIVLALAHSV